MNFNKKDLNAELVESAIVISNRILNNNDCSVVFEWSKAPKLLRDLCNQNGGDEDFLVIARAEDKLFSLTSSFYESNSDCYDLDDVMLFVLYHA